jgi:hypothetical protein
MGGSSSSSYNDDYETRFQHEQNGYQRDREREEEQRRENERRTLEITFSYGPPKFRKFFGLYEFVQVFRTVSYAYDVSYGIYEQFHECESNKFKDYILQNNNDYMFIFLANRCS